MKIEKLVKFHVIPKDNAAKAGRMETWEDVKAQIIAEPPKVETQATWHDATQSVGGFKRLVVQKTLRRKNLPKADPSESEPSDELHTDPSEELRPGTAEGLVPAAHEAREEQPAAANPLLAAPQPQSQPRPARSRTPSVRSEEEYPARNIQHY
eukprot:EG_transcript_34317